MSSGQMISLEQLLELVGDLDDSPGDKTPKERFRRFLSGNLTSVGAVRDYIEECLRHSDDQYNRALQDLVNHLGRLLDFDVVFGRYRGVQGDIGFDGWWKSPTGFHIVVEVKTTDAYTIKTSTLLGYTDNLISAQKIPDWDHALGLYVVGRSDAGLSQLENSIIAEKRTHQLRIITVDKLLTLAELLTDYEMGHEAVLTVLQPSRPTVDPPIDLMADLLAKELRASNEEAQQQLSQNATNTDVFPSEPAETNIGYYLTPIASDGAETAEERLKKLLDAGVYAVSANSVVRTKAKPGDWICFYAAGKGVIAHARMKSPAVQKHHSSVKYPEKYSYVFEVDSVNMYIDDPIVLSAELRIKLDAFRGRDHSKRWSWFVQGASHLTEHDFLLLTRQMDV